MSGRYSRNKGRRGEYLVRDKLREKGFQADRVPLSGASQGFKGDVRGNKNGRQYIFEIKLRAKGFATVYTLFARTALDGVSRLALGTPEGEAGEVLLVIADSPDRALELQGHYANYSHQGKDGRDVCDRRTRRKLLNMRRWLQGADVLVIKDDHQALLYLQYSQFVRKGT